MADKLPEGATFGNPVVGDSTNLPEGATFGIPQTKARPDLAANPPAAAGPHIDMQPMFSGQPTGGSSYQSTAGEAIPAGQATAIQQREKDNPVVAAAGHAALGAGKGAASTVGDVSSIINKIPLVGEILAPSEGITALKTESKPEGTAEKVGYGVEQISEFLAGDEALKSLSVAQRLGLAGKLAEYAKSSPRLAAILDHGLQAMRQGTVAGAQSYVHGATPTDALKTAGLATLMGAGTGAITEGAGAAYKTTKGLLSPKVLQKPLQTGIRDIIVDATKTAPVEPAPEPNYAYRSRDAGEAGIGTQGRAQATDSLSQARGYADENDPAWRGKTTGTKQELIRTDLNRLKPEDYTTTKHPDGMNWTKFNRPLAEDEVTKVTPELEASEAAEKANASSEAAKPELKSIRKTVEQAGDKVYAASKADYKVLDDATNGRFQRFRDKLANGRRQLQNLSGSEEDVQKEASILKGQKETEDAMQEAFDDAKAKGIDPKLIDRADANFRKSQALYDLDNAIKKSTTGAHPDFSTPELLKESPETLNPKMLHSRINALYDSGRLQDALGEDGANKLFDHTLEHSGAYDKIMRNRKIGLYGLGGAAAMTGVGGYVAHKLGSLALGQ